MEIEAVQELEIETEKVGPQGYSAYEVAVQNGFEGTEEEWLASLKGADGTDGEPGPQGPQGLPGTDGTNATINGVSTINIAAGENITLDQEDGTLTINSTGGGTRDYTALTNKPSINNVTLNGNKSLSDLGAGTYDKPASGIPKTDLASDVQASLNKADSALQTHQDISGKQDVLTAGDNITIENNVISAAGANYTAGDGIDITNNTISSTMPVYLITNNSSSNPFVLENCNKGIYLFGVTEDVYLKGTATGVARNILMYGGFLAITAEDTTIDPLSNSWKTMGYVYGAGYDGRNSSADGTNYSISNTAIQVWQPNGGISVSNSYRRQPIIDPRFSTTINGTHTYTVLPRSSVVPTNDNQFTNKKYVDDAVASAGSSVPTITITASQIVSQNPLQISMTAEQQAIIEDANVGTLIIDGSALGVNPAYCQKNQDGSTDILLAAFSFAWNGTSGFSISNTTIFAGRYEKETHMLYIVNTPLLGDTPTADNHLANKKYVDDAVAGAAGGNAFPTYTIDLDTIIYANGLVLSATDNAKFSNAFTDAYSKGYKSIQILINYRTNQSTSQYVYQNLMLPGVIGGSANAIDITTKPGGYSFQSVINNNGELTYPGDKTQMSIMFSTLSLVLNWSGDVCSVTNARHYQTSYVFPLLSGVLYKTNTMAYTPMSNYHPATKLYTDLSVVKASGLLPYATNKTYQLGDYIYRSATDPTLYKCKVATTSGSWVAANWEQKTYMEYLSDTLVGGALNGSY